MRLMLWSIYKLYIVQRLCCVVAIAHSTGICKALGKEKSPVSLKPLLLCGAKFAHLLHSVICSGLSYNLLDWSPGGQDGSRSNVAHK